MRPDVIVVGAGVAGLACARGLVDAGARVQVLDRARGVGGRCATRHVDGLAIDFGVIFLHGVSKEFTDCVESVEGTSVLRDWPLRRHDSGTPCQPDAFAAGSRRFAYGDGLSALPKHLARGLDVELKTEVTAIQAVGGLMQATTIDGRSFAAPSLVLALAPEQTRRLLATLTTKVTDVSSAEAMMALFASAPCVTVLAGYPAGTPEPPWDVSYPSDSPVLMLMSNESSKRQNRPYNALVYQSTPRWSRTHLEDSASALQAAILAEAGHRLGSWAAAPTWAQVHVWHYARLDRGNELARPLLVALADGARLGIAGEIFAPGGGVEAAWTSGRALAARLIAKEEHA